MEQIHFQSYLSPIQTDAGLIDEFPRECFQSYLSPIQTAEHGTVESVEHPFNPTLVQFKPCRRRAQ